VNSTNHNGYHPATEKQHFWAEQSVQKSSNNQNRPPKLPLRLWELTAPTDTSTLGYSQYSHSYF